VTADRAPSWHEACSGLAPKGSTPPHEQPQDGLGPRKRRIGAGFRSNAGAGSAPLRIGQRTLPRPFAQLVQDVAGDPQQAAVGIRPLPLGSRPYRSGRAPRGNDKESPGRSRGRSRPVGRHPEGSPGSRQAAVIRPRAPRISPPEKPLDPPAAPPPIKGASERAQRARSLTGGAASPRRRRAEIFRRGSGRGATPPCALQRPPTVRRDPRPARSSGRSSGPWRRTRRRARPSRPTSGRA